MERENEAVKFSVCYQAWSVFAKMMKYFFPNPLSDSTLEKRRKHPFALLLFSFLLSLPGILLPTSTMAGPWTMLEDEALISVSFLVSSFDGFYNRDKKKFSLPDKVVQHLTVLDLYYGFYENWEANLNFAGYKSTRRFPGDEHSQAGFGDGWAKVKHHFYRGFFDVAGQVGVKWPGDYSAELINSPGDGQVDAEFRLLVGKFWDRFYLDMEWAYLNRFGDPPNEYQLDFDMGYAVTSFLQFRFFSHMQDAWAGEGSAGELGTILPKTEEDVLSVGGGVTWLPAKDLSFTFQYSTVLIGRNTPLQSYFGATVSYKFDLFID